VCVCVCVCVDLGTQHGMRMRYIVTCGLTCCTTFFPDLRGGMVTEHKMGVLIFFTFVWKISHSKKKRRSYDQKCVLVFMYSNRYASQILINLNFLKRFWKILKYSI